MSCCCARKSYRPNTPHAEDAPHAEAVPVYTEVEAASPRPRSRPPAAQLPVQPLPTSAFEPPPDAQIPVTSQPPRLKQREYPNAVDIEKALAEVIEILDLEDQSTRRGLVLYGVGGIGKSTLATAVFTSLNLSTYKHCRINIQQDCSESHLKDLQEQVISDLFSEKIQVRNCEEGKEHLYRFFKKLNSQPVFLFIDNALRGSDLAKLLPEDLSCLSKGSKILITTRMLNETDMIREGGVKLYAYSVNYLSEPASKRLLCLKALGSADKEFNKSLDIDGLVKRCGGLPLVLELVGSTLCNLGDDVRAGESFIEFLKDALVKGEGDLSEKVVEVVYNTLEYDLYRDAFLDIATFLNNWDQRIVGYIVGVVALRAIQGAALVKISEKGKVIVHDIVLARGRKLCEGNRITDHKSLESALEDIERLEELKGIWLPPHGSPEFQLHAEDLEWMNRSLRILHLGEGNRMDGKSTETFPNLRLLHITGDLGMELTKLERLAVLEADLENSDGLPDSLCLSSLKMLNLKSSKVNCLPNSFSLMNRLEELNISHCKRVSRLPDGFGQLKSLTYLNMAGCTDLEMVSDDFEQLSSVCAVDASNCPRLDGNAMDKIVEMRNLLLLNITESPMLINRWKEVKERHPLIVLEMITNDAFRRSHEHSVSVALTESIFLHNDVDLQWSPGKGQVAFVLSMCDLSSSLKRGALETVKEKIEELAYLGFQIVYLRVGQIWNESRQRTSESLAQLPGGTRGWIAPNEKWNKLAGYSIYRLSNGGGRMVSRLHTLIASARVSISKAGKKYVEDIKLRFPVSGDVEGLEDIDGGFSSLFSPIIQMNENLGKFERHLSGITLKEGDEKIHRGKGNTWIY